jgi:ATP-dependent Clp protease ATP-binding subunit ClpA
MSALSGLKKYEIIGTVFSKQFESLVNSSIDIAKQTNSEYVYDEHLFFAMLENISCLGTLVLQHLNLNIDELKQDIIDIFSFYEEDVITLEKKEKKDLRFLTNISNIQNIHPYISRNNYIEQMIYIINKRQKNNPLLIGQAGVGKTALVYGFSKRIDKEIYELDLGGLVAGTKYRGEMEEKLLDAVEYVKEVNGILFIDEIHNIVGAGSNEGSLDIANIIKPYLSKNEIKVIAATTLDEYYKYIEKDKALTRRFQTIFIDEPSKDETFDILKGIKYKYDEFYHVDINDELIKYIIDLTDLYILNKPFPDKAIDTLDEALSRYSIINKDLKTLIIEVINERQGINIPSINDIYNIKLHYEELRNMYLRKIYPLELTKNLGIVGVDKNFNLNHLLMDLYNVFKFKKEMLLEIDLNDYPSFESLSNLIGTSKGYVGYDQGGLLYNHILKYPIQVIYIKNFDKVVQSVKLFFNNLFTKEKIVDSHQRNIFLKNTLFIVETNQVINELGFVHSSKFYNKQFDIVIKGSKDEHNEITNKLLKKGIIIDGIKTLTEKEQVAVYYHAVKKPIGKYKVIFENEQIKLEQLENVK